MRGIFRNANMLDCIFCRHLKIRVDFIAMSLFRQKRIAWKSVILFVELRIFYIVLLSTCHIYVLISAVTVLILWHYYYNHTEILSS